MEIKFKTMDEKMKIILNDFDFFISDCVPEAFELASILKKNVLEFRISHGIGFENIIKDKKMPRLIK